MLIIKPVLTKELIEEIRYLFIEYASELSVDLEFQNFDEELNTLPGHYAPPKGSILIAYYKENLAGCVALRQFQDDICEMKRLYVRSEFRGKKIGKALSKEIIQKAKELDYKFMRLDTLPFMKEAITLYSDLGFKEIKSYRYNPFDEAKFFELKLDI
ncbi:MAG: GNAT family N-acetyltransferase [Promethearchaeota archaeon]